MVVSASLYHNELGIHTRDHFTNVGYCEYNAADQEPRLFLPFSSFSRPRLSGVYSEQFNFTVRAPCVPLLGF